VRSFTAALGVISALWAVSSFQVYSREDLLGRSARAVLNGENFNAKQLARLADRLTTVTSADQNRPLTFRDIAVVRLRLLEQGRAFEYGLPIASDLPKFDDALVAALNAAPSDSFLWLMGHQIENGVSQPKGEFRRLLMSYVTGPNEAWIGVRRCPIALALFPSLPDELKVRVVQEFVGLVRSGLFADAIKLLAALGLPLRSKLTAELVHLDEPTRNSFARAVEEQGLEGVTVPSVPSRRNRPF
jgi:hypothetical protein